jgi:hypothetical protein
MFEGGVDLFSGQSVGGVVESLTDTSAVGSPVQVPKKREALAEQYSRTASAAWR